MKLQGLFFIKITLSYRIFVQNIFNIRYFEEYGKNYFSKFGIQVHKNVCQITLYSVNTAILAAIQNILLETLNYFNRKFLLLDLPGR